MKYKIGDFLVSKDKDIVNLIVGQDGNKLLIYTLSFLSYPKFNKELFYCKASFYENIKWEII